MYTCLGWPRVSDPQSGDVCVSTRHCGIYVGGGRMIHADTERVGVRYGPIQRNMIFVRYNPSPRDPPCPSTGDNANLFLWVTLSLMSLIVIINVLNRKPGKT